MSISLGFERLRKEDWEGRLVYIMRKALPNIQHNCNKNNT